MLISNAFLLIFALGFMGCILATPTVTRLAVWAGAIDRPDHFRRIHKGATPRLGGVGLAFGVALAVLLVVEAGYLDEWAGLSAWWPRMGPVALAGAVVLAIGVVDDTRAMGPRSKLIGQATAVLVLVAGGIRIDALELFGCSIGLGAPAVSLSWLGVPDALGIPALFVTMFWFLGCMNVWNLIDGMDGLASGVGLLASGTLTLVAVHNQNAGVAILAAALAGSLAGFLLYNWHPACIFLGDSGSLLIGLLLGVIGVEGSMRGPSEISILFPILAMGLPITDTAMAIFRRWVRNLPFSSADRRHIHHLLIGLGLNPRQAALLLYCFAGFLCGVVLLGVALDSEALALVLGLSGSLAFLLILTSRRDELASLRADFQERRTRGRQERFAAKLTWEAIQRIELCDCATAIRAILEETTRTLGCDVMSVSCRREGRTVPGVGDGADGRIGAGLTASVSGRTATFRLSSGQDLMLVVSLHQVSDSSLPADIAFRFLQRLSLATAERLGRLLGGPDPAEGGAWADGPEAVPDLGAAPSALALAQDPDRGSPRGRFRPAGAFGPSPASTHPSLNDE